jgi:hypothetical protein
MLPVAEEYKKILLVEPAVADAITGDKWNRYVFRTGAQFDAGRRRRPRCDPQNAQIAMLAQDYAFGRDGVKALKEALAAIGSKATIVHEEYVPQATTGLHGTGATHVRRAQGQERHEDHRIIWAGPHPLAKIADLKPERYRHRARPGRQHPAGHEGLEAVRRHRGRGLLLLRLPEEQGQRLARRRAQEALRRRRFPTSSPQAAWPRASQSWRRSRRQARPTPRSSSRRWKALSFETP